MQNETAFIFSCYKTAAEMLPYFSEDGAWLVTGYGTAAFKNAAAIAESSLHLQYIESEPLSFACAMITYLQNHRVTLKAAAEYAGPQYVRKSDAEKD